MIKLRYETVPYNHPHGAYNPDNMRRDMDEAFANKPLEEMKYLNHKLEILLSKVRILRLEQSVTSKEINNET